LLHHWLSGTRPRATSSRPSKNGATSPRFLAVVRVPTTDVSVLGTLIDDLGQWPAAEYLAVHGPKAPRQE